MTLSIFSRNFLRCVWNENIIRKISLSATRFEDDSKNTSAAEKLHILLQDIIKDETISTPNVKKVAIEFDVAPKKPKRPEKPKNLGEKIVDSAREVAKRLDGKPEETEAQLLQRLLFKNRPLSENITKAAGSETLTKILTEMEIEQTPPTLQKPQSFKELTRAEQVRMTLGKNRTNFEYSKAMVREEKVYIFGGSPFGIFKPDEFRESEVPMNTWEAMEKREFRLLVTHPPTNIYQQMIQWTEKGILWKFPINNEQGLEEEDKSDFTEHVFLETHLEHWCPEKGPIRHFMELVCVGLSQNHLFTAEEKKQHILWFKDYFTSKKALLQELGAGEIKVLTMN